MQREKVPYNPALDDGGGAPGAESQWYIPGETEDVIYADPFEPNNNAISSFFYRKPQEPYMPQIPSGNPIPSFAPRNTQPPENQSGSTSYHYLRSHSSSRTQSNFSDPIDFSNDNSHSQSTAVPIQSNSYHPFSPESPIGHTYGVGSADYSPGPRPTFTGYDRDHTSISPSQDESFDFSDNWLLESFPSYLPPAQNNTGDPQVRNTDNLAAFQGVCGYTSTHQPTPGALMTTLSPNAPMPIQSSAQGNNTWFVANHPAHSQAIGVGSTVGPPKLQAHYASPPYPQMDHPPPPFTEVPFFNSTQLYSPPTYQQGSPPHQGVWGDCAPGRILDPAGVGAAYQRARLYGHAEKAPPTITSLAPLHHSPAIWSGWMPHQQIDLGGPALPITASQHDDSLPQSLSSFPEEFGFTSQAIDKGSSDGASSSSPTAMIQTDGRTPAMDPPDTPDYGGLNTFLTQHNSLNRVSKRSRQCRPPVLKLDDCPPNLRPYYNTDIPIPPRECDTMYNNYGDKTCCIKCGYDVTPPRRPGLKYEHVSAHIDNRPYYCLKCHRGFFRKSNHSKTHYPPLWRTIPPSSR